MEENKFNEFVEKAKQDTEQELKRINEIKEKVESDLSVTEDEMRDMIRTFRNSPYRYAIRLERFREIKYTLVGLLLADVPYTKENMMKCGISLYEILYLDFCGVIALRGDGTYWVYWHENKYKPECTLDEMERGLKYWTPNTLKALLESVYHNWLNHVHFDEYIEESIDVVGTFSKHIQKEFGCKRDEE